MLKSALHDMKHPVDGGFKIIMVWYGMAWYFPLRSIYRLVHYDSQSHSQGFLSALYNNIFWGMLLISYLLTSSSRVFNSKYGRVPTLEIQTKVSKVSSMFFYVSLITITECNNKKTPRRRNPEEGS